MGNPFPNLGDNVGLLVLLFIISIWQLFWKGVALWRSANQKQRNWFLAMFILIPLNDFGIIELVYLFRFSKKRLTIDEVKSWFQKN